MIEAMLFVAGAGLGFLAGVLYYERRERIVKKVHDEFTKPPAASELFKDG